MNYLAEQTANFFLQIGKSKFEHAKEALSRKDYVSYRRYMDLFHIYASRFQQEQRLYRESVGADDRRQQIANLEQIQRIEQHMKAPRKLGWQIDEEGYDGWLKWTQTLKND